VAAIDSKYADIPDARDGLTRKERVVLWALRGAEAERNGRGVRAAMLYGRVLEHVDMSIAELMRIIERLSRLRHPLLVRSSDRKPADER
jgi:DNA gyrase/topoisomerase IV subunit A